MKAVFKREFSSAFHRLTAYVAVALQLFFSAVVISSNNLSYTLSSVSKAVSFMSLLTLAIIPVIAGEFIPCGKRAGVDRVYGALPLLDRQIALGKYFAAAAVTLIADLFLIFSPFLAGFFGTVDHLMSYTAILGLLLLQAAALALCMLVFKTVKNRILAFVTIYVSGFLMIAVSVFIIYFPTTPILSLLGLVALGLLLGTAAWLFTQRPLVGGITAAAVAVLSAVAYIIFPKGFAGLFVTVITALSPIDRFNRFINGVLDFGSVLYFLSLAFLLLWCLCRNFEVAHEPCESRPSMSLKRITSAAVVLLITAALCLVNVAAEVLPPRFSGADATVSKNATPSDKAVDFLSDVEKDVDFYLLEPTDTTSENAMDYRSYRLYLDRLVATNPRFSLTTVYGAATPEFYEERELTQNDVVPNSLIIQCGDRWEYVNFYTLLCYGNSDFSKSYMSVSELEYWRSVVYSMYQSNPDYEKHWRSINYNTTSYRYADTAISFMVEYVTKDIIPTAYYLTGHGEGDMYAPSSVFYNMGLEPLDTTLTEIPPDAASIVVNLPTEDFSEKERDAFLEYLSGGGQMTFLTNKENLGMPNLCDVLSAYGMSVENEGYVTYQQKVGEDGETEATTDIVPKIDYTCDPFGEISSSNQSDISLTDANAIVVSEEGLEYPTVYRLLESPSDCYLGDSEESGATYTVACAVETPSGARVVWFTGGESVGKSINGASNLVASALSWVTLEYTTVTDGITPTLYAQPSTPITSGGATAVSMLLYLTAIGVLVFGVVELYRRKKAV